MAGPNIISTVAVKEPPVAQALSQLETYLNKTAPYAKFQYVTVTFNASANLDTEVMHGLAPRDPEAVDFQVVKIDKAGSVYYDNTGTRRKWQANYIVLRCSAASATATLLLTLRPI